MEKKITIQPKHPLVPEKDAFVLELQRLLACYQLAVKETGKLCGLYSINMYHVSFKTKDSPVQGLSLCIWEKHYGKKRKPP